MSSKKKKNDSEKKEGDGHSKTLVAALTGAAIMYGGMKAGQEIQRVKNKTPSPKLERRTFESYAKEDKKDN